jgi:outer membrane protein OmpA-like peptidoglycan-associated protein
MKKFLLILLCASAHADPDVKGGKDYPLFQRFPHSHLDAYEERVWDRRTFEVKGGKPVAVDGHRLRLHYAMDKGAEKVAAVEYLRNYENAFRSAGWRIDRNDNSHLIVVLDKREIWLDLYYDQGNGSAEFNIVEKEPMPALIQAGKATPATHPKPDFAGGKDYAGIPRLPHQRLSGYEERKFDVAEFSLADGTRRRIEGHKISMRYEMDQAATPRPATIHAMLSYRDVLSAEGWAILRIDSHITAVLRDHDKETWADIYYDGGSGSATVTIVEPGEMKQVVSASSLLERLKREGRVSFEVHFDTNQDVIKPESKSVVAQMVELLKSDATLKVEIAGHTDNVGNEKDNLALSQRRATSVMSALTTAGIEVARLTAKGYGQSRPVADNGSEGGRALNRRVELVKR